MSEFNRSLRSKSWFRFYLVLDLGLAWVFPCSSLTMVGEVDELEEDVG